MAVSRLMIEPMHTTLVNPTGLRLEHFTADTPLQRPAKSVVEQEPEAIDGVSVTSLKVNSDGRGSLSELLTTRGDPIEPIVHVYHVRALAGSIRAWVYHRLQSDRLAFCEGLFEIALYDIRIGSPTMNRLAVFRLGSERPALLRIPPFVIHGVVNIGHDVASFVNMPTQAYNPEDPDKYRLAYGDPRIPHRFHGT